jgi:hypothetical protein
MFEVQQVLKHNRHMLQSVPFLQRIKYLLTRRTLSVTEQRAHDLIVAIDAGGLILNAARVNAIARDLGLEVSTRASVNDTIERIRAALKRARE